MRQLWTGRFWCALLGMLGLIACQAHAQGPDPNTLYITSIDNDGTGCPQGTIGKSMSANGLTFTLIFDNFIASAGTGIPRSEGRKTCVLTLNLHVPTGWHSSVLTTDRRGYVALAVGSTAKAKTKYSRSQTTSQTGFNGPAGRDYLLHDDVSFAAVKSCKGSPCLTATIVIGVNKNGMAGADQMTTDSLDGQITLTAVN